MWESELQIPQMPQLIPQNQFSFLPAQHFQFAPVTLRMSYRKKKTTLFKETEVEEEEEEEEEVH